MCPLHKLRQWFRNREDIATTRCKQCGKSTQQPKVARSFFCEFHDYISSNIIQNILLLPRTDT